MAQTQVQILEIKDDHLIVSGQRTGGCTACAQRKSCGVKGAELESKRSFTLTVPYSKEDLGEDIETGDMISVACSETHLLKAIATLFGLPLVGLILAPLLLTLCFPFSQPPSDLSIFIAALGGTLAGLWSSRKLASTFSSAISSESTLSGSTLSEPTIRVVTNPTKAV